MCHVVQLLQFLKTCRSWKYILLLENIFTVAKSISIYFHLCVFILFSSFLFWLHTIPLSLSPRTVSVTICITISPVGYSLCLFPLSYFFHVFLIKYINLKPTLQNSVLTQNYMRVAEVWLDEYKDSFYATKPLLEGKPCGNISEQVEYRRQNCPKSFKWFMEEIAFDNLQEYPPPAKNKIWGEVCLYLNRFWDVYILI